MYKLSEVSEIDSVDCSGGEVKLYPAGKCRICPNPLARTNPLDVCYRCQDRGIRGDPRKPIKPEASKEGGKL